MQGPRRAVASTTDSEIETDTMAKQVSHGQIEGADSRAGRPRPRRRSVLRSARTGSTLVSSFRQFNDSHEVTCERDGRCPVLITVYNDRSFEFDPQEPARRGSC